MWVAATIIVIAVVVIALLGGSGFGSSGPKHNEEFEHRRGGSWLDWLL